MKQTYSRGLFDDFSPLVSVVKTFGTFGGVIERGSGASIEECYAALAAVKQASVLDGLSFDPFSFKQAGLDSAEVHIGGGEVGDILVVLQTIVVSDERADPGFEIARPSAAAPCIWKTRLAR